MMFHEIRKEKEYRTELARLMKEYPDQKKDMKRSRILMWMSLASLIALVVLSLAAPYDIPIIYQGNEYYVTAKNEVEKNAVSFRPYHVFYDGDTLVMKCLIVNGTSYSLSDKFVIQDLTVRDSVGSRVARASFRVVHEIKPNEIGNVAFRFAKGVKKNASLNQISIDLELI